MQIQTGISWLMLATATSACSAGPAAEEDPIDTRSDAIVNAEGVGNLASHAVALSNGCSGTLLRNDVVVTAAHCVQSNNPRRVYPIDGLGKVQTTAGVSVAEWAEPGDCEDIPGLCPADRNQTGKVDVAMLRLSSPIAVDGDSANLVRGLFTGSSDDLFDTIMFCQGRGGTVCGDGKASNTNRWSRFVVTNVSSSRMHFEGYNRTTVVSNGDSGGGCYAAIASTQAPNNQISAVITNFTCPDKSRSEPLEVIRPWVRGMLGKWATSKNYTFSSTSQLSEFQIVDASPSSGGPSDWKITGGALRQNKDIKGTGNAPSASGTHALVNGVVMANGCVTTKVTSSDDDKAGIVFRYYDEDYYYRFYAAEPNIVRLSRVIDGVESTIQSGQKSINWSNGVTLKVCMTDDFIRGQVNGTTVISTHDSTFGDGRVGLYDRLLVDANFDYLTITHDGTVYPEF